MANGEYGETQLPPIKFPTHLGGAPAPGAPPCLRHWTRHIYNHWANPQHHDLSKRRTYRLV